MKSWHLGLSGAAVRCRGGGPAGWAHCVDQRLGGAVAALGWGGLPILWLSIVGAKALLTYYMTQDISAKDTTHIINQQKELDHQDFFPRKREHLPSLPPAPAVDCGGDSVSTIAADMVTGSHELTVSGYSGTKGLGVGKYISSAAFSIGGHSWTIRYYPDGDADEAAGWVSVYLKLGDKGDVRARFSLSLLDQAGKPVPSYSRTSSQVRPFSTAHGPWGYTRFIESKDLESSPCLKDDSFRIRCEITVVVKIRAEATPVRILAAPSSDLHRDLGGLLAGGVGGDVKFKVGRETITAHKYVLAARSSVFKAELFGQMKERKSTRIRIDDVEPVVFRAMLHFIYTDTLPEMEEDDKIAMAQHLLVAADRYNLQRLKLVCEDVLCNFIDTSNAATTLTLAEQHACHRLKDGCFKFLESKGNLKAVMATDGFKYLTFICPSLLTELLSKVAP
ncbi:hypothetical protein ACP70R_007685 [Stipagrostis hirtigluma subsp. patula]